MANEVKRITWDEPEKRKYEYGVSQGVFYGMDEHGAYTQAEPWNGLTNVTDSPSGADNTKLWADGIEYASIRAAEQYGCGIEAYTYPDGFAICDGSASPMPGVYIRQQTRKKFGMSWRTEVANADNPELGYKIHVAYGLTVSPSESAHDTVNDNPDAATFSWDAEGSAVPITGYKPSAKVEFDSLVLGEAKMAALEDLLYGRAATTGENAQPAVAASLPLPDAIIAALSAVT